MQAFGVRVADNRRSALTFPAVGFKFEIRIH
jgi:hypothetical protein